jgi:hypothetical protein
MPSQTSRPILQKGVTGAATIGRIYAVIGIIVSLIITGCLVPIGIYLLANAKKHSVPGIATIANVSNDIPLQQSNLTLSYTYNNSNYTKTIETTYNASFAKGTPIDILINPSNPKDVILKSDNPPYVISFFLIGLALFILIASIIHLFLTFRFKSFAAASGVADVVGTVSNAARL